MICVNKLSQNGGTTNCISVDMMQAVWLTNDGTRDSKRLRDNNISVDAKEFFTLARPPVTNKHTTRENLSRLQQKSRLFFLAQHVLF
jgi:hypothetical protein